MKLFDLRKASNNGFKIYDILDDVIIYGQEIADFNGVMFGVYSFDNMSKENNLIYKYEITPGKVHENYVKIFGDKMIHINTELYGTIMIRSLDLFNFDEEVSEKEISYKGNIYRSPTYIDGDHFILFTETNESQSQEYDRYKDAIDYYKFAELVDIRDLSKTFISDLRIVNGIRRHLTTFIKGGEEFVLFEESYLDEWEREDLYNRDMINTVMNNRIIESINIISKARLLKDIKKSVRDIEFIEIESRTLDGWCRYLGQSKKEIMYTVKDFESKLESIYSYDIEADESTLVSTINHHDHLGRLIHNKKDKSIIEVLEKEETISVKGLFNSSVDYEYDKGLGHFVGLNNDNIITWYSKSGDDYYKEKVVVIDTKTGETEKFDGHYKKFEQNIVLF
ncbi:MAG: hypothetical protein WBA54_05550 [Acidaminobacteraceae bacterium]